MHILPPATGPSASPELSRRRLLVFALLAALAVAAWLAWGDRLSLAALADREAALRAYQQEHPLLVYGAAFLVYVLVTGLSLPAATALTLLFGWYFGFWRGVLLVSFGATSGATVAFLLSRHLLRDAVRRRLGGRVEKVDAAFRRDGPFYLFLLRLTPAVPFFVINLAMGLTSLRTGTFWLVSQVGMLPATLLFVYAASQVPDLRTLAERGPAGLLSPQLIVAFVLIGVSPLAIRKVVQRFRRTPDAPDA